jgi:hypothetical protein
MMMTARCWIGVVRSANYDWVFAFPGFAACVVLASFSVRAAIASASEQNSTTSGSQQSTDRFLTSPELERRDQPVTADDLRILKRADEILSTPTKWSRHDTRICKPKDKTWSLFCAMEKASLDVLGEDRYRAVALQEVRFACEDAMKGMKVQFQHRLTDYNNLPSTRFEDIKNVLKVATDRVSTGLASQNK